MIANRISTSAMWSSLLFTTLLWCAPPAQAEYRVCRSQVDGRPYLQCPPEDCIPGDSLVAFNPGDHPNCTPGTLAGDCGEHWTGWQGPGVAPDNSCPPGCSKSGVTDNGSRLVGFPPRPQYREKWRCAGTPIPPEPIDPMVGRSFWNVPNTGSWSGFSGTASGPLSTCPAGTYVTQIQGFKSGSGGISERTPIAEVRFWCKTLDGTGSFVGRSAGSMPTSGSWSGFSGTLQGGPGACPPGYFVKSIQGFKAGSGGITEHNPISELRFECETPDGASAAVGKSFGGIPDEGSWGGFSGTVKGGVATCPRGAFVVAIQGFKSGSGGITEHSPISELRFPCQCIPGTHEYNGACVK